MFESPTDAEILDGLKGEIPTITAPVATWPALVALGTVQVLLALVHVALPPLIGVATVLHATGELFRIPATPILVWILAYTLPLALGVVLFVSLAAPLVVPARRGPLPRRVRREDEPFLFAFVENLSRTVGAPAPAVIQVDTDPDAAVGFRRGFAGLPGKGLVLTIGMPLVLGLDLRSLAGVLAHEMGHFSQKAGMRLGALVRGVDGWFTSAIRNPRGLALANPVLRILRGIGRISGAALFRRMEFAADRTEIHVAGSRRFERTSRRLAELHAAALRASEILGEELDLGRLPDDVPRLVAEIAKDLPDELLALAEAEFEEHETGLLAAHPATGDRISVARRVGAVGMFRIEAPAARLFSDAEALSIEATLHDYHRMLREDLGGVTVLPLDEIRRLRNREDEEVRAARRYFRAGVTTLRPLTLAAEPQIPHGSTDETRDRLGSMRDAMNAAIVDHRPRLERCVTLAFDRLGSDETEGMADERLTLEGALRGYEDLAVARLELALGILARDGIAGGAEDVPALRSALRALSSALEECRDLTVEYHSLVAILCDTEGLARSQAKTVLGRLTSLREILAAVPHPAPTTPAHATVADDVLPEMPPERFDETALTDLLGICKDVTHRLPAIYVTVLGRLARIAEAVEEALGLSHVDEG